MMAKPLEPEIFPPGVEPVAAGAGLDDEQLDWLATLLDDLFTIPGTRIRFGLDALAGLIPGVGDALTGVASFLILHAAWQRGLPRVALLRMLAHVALDSIAGTVPVLGDLFDVAYKSNRRNVELLRRYQERGNRQQSKRDWFFLLFLVLTVALLVALPFLLLAWVISLLRS